MTMTRIDHKQAYKSAMVTLQIAAELIDCWEYVGRDGRRRLAGPRDAMMAARKARQQAGRVLVTVGTTDERLDAALHRYRADLNDFHQDFDGAPGYA